MTDQTEQTSDQIRAIKTNCTLPARWKLFFSHDEINYLMSGSGQAGADYASLLVSDQTAMRPLLRLLIDFGLWSYPKSSIVQTIVRP